MMNKLIVWILILMPLVALMVSCGDMNEIQREFADREEQIYLGKVDSIKSVPGFGRAKIVWYIGADPKIEQTVIYWNQGEDSIVKDFIRIQSGLQKDSIIVENLPEGSTLFEFKNINSKGESSLVTSAAVTAWGGSFAENLRARTLNSLEFDYEGSNYFLELSSTTNGDSVVYSQIVYMDNKGKAHDLKVDRETNDVVLTDFADDTEFLFRNVFFLPEGLDTVYADYQTYKSPKAVFESGKKIVFSGNPLSRYSEMDNTGFYEWTQDGDLLLYRLNESGSISVTESYLALVPRSTYRDFFFYDDDKFIGINISNQVSMHIIDNYELAFVKATSSSGNTFGSGFGMDYFIPAKGFFYSLTDGTLRTWFASNNATWGSPNGTTVSTDFVYYPFAVFNSRYLIGVDEEGFLWSFPLKSTGALKAKTKIGSGWNKFTKIIPVGTKLICIDGSGEFYEFDFNASDNFWVVE